MEAPPPDLAEVLPGTPRRAAEVLKRGLAKDPAERPASAGELVRELSAAYADAAAPRREPVARSSARPPRPRSSRSTGTGQPRLPSSAAAAAGSLPAALAAIAAVAVAIVLIAGSGADDKPSSQAGASEPGPATKQPGKDATGGRRPRPPLPPRRRPTRRRRGPRARPDACRRQPHRRPHDFYTRAANDDFEGAWALGTDNLHKQFGAASTSSAAPSATLESISFPDPDA